MRYLIHLIFATCVALMAAAALANETSGSTAKKKSSRDECVFFSTLYDWRALDDNNMVLWAPGQRGVYQVELTLPLLGLRFAETLAFIDSDENHQLCSYGRDAVGTNDGGIPGKSSIRRITRLDAGGIAKLEEKYKVDLSRGKNKKKIPSEPARETAQ